MKKKIFALALLVVLAFSLCICACAFPAEGDAIPYAYGCPGSADGFHHYAATSDYRQAHVRVSTARCNTYAERRYACTACRDSYYVRFGGITEHEYGGSACEGAGDFTS